MWQGSLHWSAWAICVAQCLLNFRLFFLNVWPGISFCHTLFTPTPLSLGCSIQCTSFRICACVYVLECCSGPPVGQSLSHTHDIPKSKPCHLFLPFISTLMESSGPLMIRFLSSPLLTLDGDNLDEPIPSSSMPYTNPADIMYISIYVCNMN